MGRRLASMEILDGGTAACAMHPSEDGSEAVLLDTGSQTPPGYKVAWRLRGDWICFSGRRQREPRPGWPL